MSRVAGGGEGACRLVQREAKRTPQPPPLGCPPIFSHTANGFRAKWTHKKQLGDRGPLSQTPQGWE